MSPESTDGREGFIHPTGIEGNAAAATLRLILRDHDEEALAAKGRLLKAHCRALGAGYPQAAIRCRITGQYRNMGIWLRERMAVVDLARDACTAAGINPCSPPIRGGTDGARLTERGLPTPNLFCGARNPHGPLEWVAREDMGAALAVLVKLVQLWEEKGTGFEGYALPAQRPDG